MNRKFLLLYVLNISDIVMTLALLESKLFAEANPLMIEIVREPIRASILKIILVGLLILYCMLRCRWASKEQLRKASKIVDVVLIIYVGINFVHILNFLYLMRV